MLVVLALLQLRLLGSHLGRMLARDARRRRRGALLRHRPDRYKALAFAVGGFAAGISGRHHRASLFLHQPRDLQRRSSRILALTIVILGGLGNVAGAIVGAVALVGLPEVFRVAAEYRMLIYGIVLLLLVRFRPQGLLGTV